MTLLISHISALDFWRKAYPIDRAPDPEDTVPARELERELAIRGCVETEEEAWCVAPPLITPALLEPEGGVLHVTVWRREARNRSRTLYCHCWGGAIPDCAFYRLSEGTYVASPEFAFLQMARSLSPYQLIALGYELCGLFSLDADCSTGVRQRTKPLITPWRLESFLEQVELQARLRGRMPQGQQKARRAVREIIPDSASPTETALAMLLSLPCRMGGYGLPKPIMNHEIALSDEAVAVARRHALKADLWWDCQRIDLEFNGRVVHSGEQAGSSDRARTNALMLMGCTVVEVTSRQLMQWRVFESLALYLAKLLGKRVRASQRGPLPQRIALREELFAWNSAGGRAVRL